MFSHKKLLARVHFFPLVVSLIFGPTLAVIPVFVPLAEAAQATLEPNASGFQANLLNQNLNSINNWDSANDSNGDTSFVRYGAAWATDLYNLSDPISPSGTINSVIVYIEARAVHSNIQQTGVRPAIRTGSTTYNGTEKTLTTNYAVYSDTWVTNPQTSSAWTWTDINNLQAGVSLRNSKLSGNPADIESRATHVWVVVNYSTSTATSTAVSSSTNPSTYGSSVIFTATVTGSSPTGSVEFFDGAASLGSAALSGGTGNFSTSALTAGSHSITAVYSGDGGNAGSTSPVLTQVVNKAPLTVTADNFSRAFGAANPTFTASYSGFVNSEVLGTSGVSGAPSLTTTATPTSPVSGSPYVITAGTGSLASSNYSFVFVNGQLTVTSVSTSTSTVLSAPNASIVGDPVTLTGSVSGGFSPTGDVQFLSGSVVIGTGSLTGGNASISVIFTAVGNYQLTAHYLGDGNNDPSTSGMGTLQVVNKASPVTSTVLNAPSTSIVGNAVTLTGNVNGGFNPTGTVEFLSGSVLLGTGSLTAGSASLSHTFTVVGSYTLTAHYLGDASNNPSSSTGTVMQVVNKASPVTSTVLNAPSTSIVGNAVTLTGNVNGGFNPTGTVEFLSGSTLLGSATLSGGSASITFTFTTVGHYNLTAHYLGDASNNDSASASAALQVVNKAASSTSTAIGVPNSSIVGDLVLFTATVSGGYLPTGTVNFLEGAVVLGSGALLAGSATFSTAALSVGNHPIHAEYLGDASNLGSSSPSAIIQVVDKFPSSTALSVSTNLSYVGDSVTLTAVVTGFFPTGTVTFRDNGIDIGTVTLSNESGSLVVSSLTIGAHSFDAAYSGDVSNVSSTSNVRSHIVSLAPPPTGGSHGHNVSAFSNVVHFVLANASGGGGSGRGGQTVAPGAFGGAGDNVILPNQRALLCVLQRSIAPRSDSSLIIWIAHYMSPFFSLKPEVILQALEDSALCSGTSASALSAPVNITSAQQIMPVDSKGIPLSTNPIWNACIRHNISISANDLTPLSCGRYHQGRFWTHPDSLITFKWSNRIKNQLDAVDKQPLLVLQVR